MKFCNNSNFTLPKQSQRSRSVLEDGSRSLGLFWTEKNLRLITEEIRYLNCCCICDVGLHFVYWEVISLGFLDFYERKKQKFIICIGALQQ